MRGRGRGGGGGGAQGQGKGFRGKGGKREKGCLEMGGGIRCLSR